MKFDEKGQNIGVRAILQQLQGGSYHTIYPFDLALKERDLPAPGLVAAQVTLAPAQEEGGGAAGGSHPRFVSMFTVPTADVLIQGIISGVLMGCIYALIAAGLSLIFGLMEIVNFAHGEFLMLAMYTAFWMYTLFALDPLFSVPICAGVLFVLGCSPTRGSSGGSSAPPCWRRSSPPSAWGSSSAPWPSSSGRRTSARCRSRWCRDRSGSSASPSAFRSSWPRRPRSLAFGFLYWFITKTETGAALEATAQDRQAAALMGINTERMFTLGWGISSACVGVAGAFLASFFYVFPYVGSLFGLLAYVTVALGGFGSIPGRSWPGILIGVIEVLAGLLIAPAFKYVAVFLRST